MGLTCGSVGVLKGAITIAIRYSAGRQQFGPPDAPEVSVLDYQSQQLKLIPILATTYALHFAKDTLVSKYCDMKRTKDAKLIEEVHAIRYRGAVLFVGVIRSVVYLLLVVMLHVLIV